MAALRALRAARILPMVELHRRLRDNPAFRHHVAAVAKDDAVFFLSHRHYLASGLTPRQRAATALHHYEHELRAFDAGYLDAVYRGPGLPLWRGEGEGADFELRLLPGNDVLYEGGVSVVAFHRGARVAVLSYANVPTEVFTPGYVPGPGEAPLGPWTVFVTRKQLAADHAYQRAFNRAFDRATPAHFCFAALAGIALAQGLSRVVAIVPEVHPSCCPGLEHRFEAAYTAFWTSLSGRRASPFGFLVDLPMRLTPLEALDGKSRKRAVVRRRHLQEVQDRAQAAIARHLVAPPVAAHLGTPGRGAHTSRGAAE